MITVPARNGWLWIGRGFALFRRAPLRWVVLVFAYWLVIALLNRIPYAGALVATLMLPAFSVSFMIVSHELAQGRPIGLPMLFSGFRHRLPALVTLGGLYLAAILLVLGMSAWVDGGTLWQWVINAQVPPPQSLRDGSLSAALLLSAALGTPVMMAFWFAPVLAAWQEMGAAKALFFSFFAAWRNWRAFLLYGAALALIGVAASLAIGAIALFVAAKLLPARLFDSVPVVISLALLPMLFGSFYASYCDIFPRADAPPPDSAPAES